MELSHIYVWCKQFEALFVFIFYGLVVFSDSWTNHQIVFNVDKRCKSSVTLMSRKLIKNIVSNHRRNKQYNSRWILTVSVIRMLIQFNSMSYVTLQNTSRAPFVSDNFIRTIEVLPRKHRLSQSVTLKASSCILCYKSPGKICIRYNIWFLQFQRGAINRKVWGYTSDNFWICRLLRALGIHVQPIKVIMFHQVKNKSFSKCIHQR